MLTLKFLLPASMVTAMALVSCELPKPVTLKVPVPKKEEAKVEEPAVPEVADQKPPSDILIPPMLDLPVEGEFRATNPGASKPAESGAVNSRPPTDPPSRVKPKEPASE